MTTGSPRCLYLRCWRAQSLISVLGAPPCPAPLYGTSVFCYVLGPEQQQGRGLPCLRKECVGTEVNNSPMSCCA